MKIVNKVKFVRTISVLVVIIVALVIFTKSAYSKGEMRYKEDFIYSGDTLWSIAEKEIINNKYFNNKDIREVVLELKDINNLKDSNLVVGEKIKIPIY